MSFFITVVRFNVAATVNCSIMTSGLSSEDVPSDGRLV